MKRTTTAPFLVLTVFAYACGAPIPDTDRLSRAEAGVVSIAVSIPSGNIGTPTVPLPYSEAPLTLPVHLEVHGADAVAPLASFNDYVAITVMPGVLTSIVGANGTTIFGRNVQMHNGVGDVTVTFNRSFGIAQVWAEDQGYQPLDPGGARPPQCADGIDNDQDGRVDYPADYGCAAPNDDSELGGSYALGSSPPIYYASPRIYDLHGGSTSSPLHNQRVGVSAGTLIVTGINTSGLYVTDIDDRSCPDPAAPTDPTRNHACYNSIFAFNFSLPVGIRPCDQLASIQGGVTSFAGTLQLDQPAWTIAPNGLWIDTGHSGACRIPDGVNLDPSALSDPTGQLAPYQSSMVRARGILWPTNVGPGLACTRSGSGPYTCSFGPGRSSCDVTNDGIVTFTNPVENMCATACSKLQGCSEWTDWMRFGQINVDYAMNQPGSVVRLAVTPKSAFPDFDPLHPPATPATGIIVTGILKNAGPTYIIQPRCAEDMALTADAVIPANQSCLLPRTLPPGE